MLPNESELFWDNLTRIQNTLLKSDSDFAQYLDIKLDEFMKLKLTGGYLPMTVAYELAEKLNFHFEDLMFSELDVAPINRWVQKDYILPDRYSQAAYSKTPQSANALNYLLKTRGERVKLNLMRKFQLSEDFITNGGNNVNVLMLTDITQYLARTHQLTEEDFISIGQMTPSTIKNQKFRDTLTAIPDIVTLMEYFVYECAHMFDRNFKYKIKSIERDCIILEALPNRQVIDELGISGQLFGNEQTCLTRMGVFSSITSFGYNKNAKVTKIASAYNGGTTNLYKFEIAPFRLKLLSGLGNDSSKSNTIYH